MTNWVFVLLALSVGVAFIAGLTVGVSLGYWDGVDHVLRATRVRTAYMRTYKVEGMRDRRN